jgi:hypothetical protein
MKLEFDIVTEEISLNETVNKLKKNEWRYSSTNYFEKELR